MKKIKKHHVERLGNVIIKNLAGSPSVFPGSSHPFLLRSFNIQLQYICNSVNFTKLGKITFSKANKMSTL
jgi:hypothetical protein